MRNPPTALFCSLPTFLNWFFSWAANTKNDFRKDIDPFCEPAPTILACNGSHVGVSFRQLNIVPMEKSEEGAALRESYQLRSEIHNKTLWTESSNEGGF